MNMHTVFFALWITAFLFALWLQFRYKDANYPGDWRWRTKLFASGAAIGIFGAVAFLLDADPKLLLAVALYGGLFHGLLFGFASPHSMKGLYPKRPNNEPTHHHDNE
jgi:hypothetical protein